MRGLLFFIDTLDDTKKPHISHAQNPLIAQIMYNGKYLKTCGHSIELMNDECAIAGVPKPEFDVVRRMLQGDFPEE